MPKKWNELRRKSLYLVINEDRFFLSHRSRIAEKAVENKWDVTLVTKDTGLRSEIEKRGFRYIELPINPTGMNLKDELKTFRFLYKLFKSNPDTIIHLVGLKNMLWGGLAARLTKARGVLFAVSGLGTLFGENKNKLQSKAIQKVLKFGMGNKNVAVIFQNHDDESLFNKSGLKNNCKQYYIKGSGVDLKEYPEEHAEKTPLQILFTARMLKEKGVEDLIKAAELLRKEYEGRIVFILCGDLSNNPNAMSLDELRNLTDGKYIKWLGHRNDIPELLKSASIMCFPSYYREGVPKSLLEASAAGLPIVTCDSVGCRDTVVDGLNGFLISPHSPGEIAEALKKLIDNPGLRKSMGRESRKIAVKDYNVEDVAEMHMKIYESLIS